VLPARRPVQPHADGAVTPEDSIAVPGSVPLATVRPMCRTFARRDD